MSGAEGMLELDFGFGEEPLAPPASPSPSATPGSDAEEAAARGRRSRRDGSKARLRAFFLERVGQVVNAYTLMEVAGGKTEWARRVRELRQHEGLDIRTDKDDSSLKPGEYRLASLERLPVRDATISKEIRALVLDRDGSTCQVCGAAAGEPHPDDGGRPTRLHIGHIRDASQGGTSHPENLRALCSLCNEGAANVTLPRPEAAKLLSQIRRAPRADQLQVLEFLARKFPEQARAVAGEAGSRDNLL